MSTFSLKSPAFSRNETPEPNVKQGRRNDTENGGIQLLDADGDLSEKLEACLGHIFSKYIEPPFTSHQAESGLLVPEPNAYLTSTGLDRYAIDTNGQPFTEEAKAELREFLDVDEDGHLTQAELASARDVLFKEAQNTIEELSRQILDLTENFEGQKLRNRQLKGENEDLAVQLEELRPALRASENEKSLVVCLIDGDGAIFHEDLLTNGKEGGHEAAGLLGQGLVKQFEQSSRPVPREIKTMIFINMEGLGRTLERNSVCTTRDFGQFVVGFNEASPLFSIVDCGYDKEAAVAKLKGML
ncbi:hypothetical protein FRB97_005050 [Tulasnella sp. 331]|nr:hypothetical protein FRB97_005050 [Tulasnella sp. 331]